MVTIDIKKLLRDERRKRITPITAAVQEESDEHPACSLAHQVDLASFAVGADKLQAGHAVSAVRCAWPCFLTSSPSRSQLNSSWWCGIGAGPVLHTQRSHTAGGAGDP